MTSRTSTVTLSVRDQFTATLNAYKQGMLTADQATTKLAATAKQSAQANGQLGKSLGQIAAGAGLSLGLAGATAAIIGLGKESIGLAMRLEQSKVAFTTLTGSAEDAQAHLEELRDFAATTPFQFTELLEASKRMHAFGFETSQVLPMLTDIGDAAAAMGASAGTIDRITLAFGQMSAKGKVSAQEMMQLTEAGIPAWKYLAEGIGVTTAEAMKLSERGLVPAGDAIQYILAGMREDFGGMMAEQANTAAGALSNLKDEANQLLTVMGEFALDPLTKAFKAETEGLQVARLLTEANKEGVISWLEMQAIGFQVTYGFKSRTAAIEELTKRLEEHANKTRVSADAEIYLAQRLMATSHAEGTAAEAANAWTLRLQGLADSMGVTTKANFELGDASTRAARDQDLYGEAVVRARDAQAAAQQSLSDRAAGFFNLAEAMKGATVGEIAQEQIRNLKDLMDKGLITEAQYEAGWKSIGLTYGLVTPQSIAIAETTDRLTFLLGAGLITQEDFNEAIGKLPAAAADGIVSMEELGVSVAEGPVKEFGYARDRAEEFEGVVTRLDGLTANTYINTYHNDIYSNTGTPTYGTEGYEHGSPVQNAAGGGYMPPSTPPSTTPTPPPVYTPPGPDHGEQGIAGGGGGALVVNVAVDARGGDAREISTNIAAELRRVLQSGAVVMGT